MKTKKQYITDPEELGNYIAYYLSETVENADWDCEHLALNMLRELKIEKPDWWDKRLGNKK